MLAQRQQAHAGRQRVTGKFMRRVRKQGLAAMSGGHDAGTAIERGAEVVPVSHLRRAGMDAHTCAKHCRLRPNFGKQSLLNGKGCGQRVSGDSKGGGDAVPGCLEDDAVAVGNCLSEKCVMSCNGLSHGIGKGFPEFGPSFNVGEQEGDSPGWQVHTALWPISP